MRISNGTVRFDVPDEFADRTHYVFEEGLDRVVAHYDHFAADRTATDLVDEALEDARAALSGLPAAPTLEDTTEPARFAGVDAVRCLARITGPDGVTRVDFVVTRSAPEESFTVNAYCYGDSPMGRILESAASVSDVGVRAAMPGYAWRWFGRFGFYLPEGFASHTDEFAFTDDAHDVTLRLAMEPPAHEETRPGIRAADTRIVRSEPVALASLRAIDSPQVYLSGSAALQSAGLFERVWQSVVRSVGPDR